MKDCSFNITPLVCVLKFGNVICFNFGLNCFAIFPELAF